VMTRVDTELAPQMGLLMSQANRTLGSVEQTLSTDAPLQQDLRRTLRDLSGAGYALRSLAEYLERHPESLIRGKKEDRP
jgi:paraquat-inducible protein B